VNAIPDPAGLTCFQSPLPFGCTKCSLLVTGNIALSLDDVLRYVTNGNVLCCRCRTRIDVREQFAHFPVFGMPEGLFGLHTWTGMREVPASKVPAILPWDVGPSLPYEGRIVYANITMAGPPDPDQLPFLMLRSQSPHAPWPTYFRFHVPASEAERTISLTLVVKPHEPPMPLALEIALQGVEAFHHNQLGVATILLAAAVEAALRGRFEAIYRQRRLRMPELGFASLVERGELLFAPRLGAKLGGHLNALAKVGRNVAAHGKSVQVSREDVAGWMVDVAAVYEWAQHATAVAPG
jgi:hypothetical protein